VGPVVLLAGLGLAGCTDDHPTSGPSASASADAPPPVVGEALADGPLPARPKVSKATLDYFFTVALGGHDAGDASVALWPGPVVVVHLSGTVTAKSRGCANSMVADFNALSATTKLRISSGPGDIELHIVPQSKFKSIEPTAQPNTDGFTRVSWQSGNEITAATVVVESSGISDSMRCSLIRRQLTGAMGLLGGPKDHPTSIFTDAPGAYPTKYSALDKQVIKLLYSGAIHPLDDRALITREVAVS
jgi:hypothetical protein